MRYVYKYTKKSSRISFLFNQYIQNWKEKDMLTRFGKSTRKTRYTFMEPNSFTCKCMKLTEEDIIIYEP